MDVVLPAGDATNPVKEERVISDAERSLSPLGNLIFLDRYACKDQDRTHLRPGDVVVACPDLASRQRLIGQVKEIRDNARTVLVQLGNEDPIEIPSDQVDLPVETLTQAHRRVARAVAGAEGDKAAFWTKEFYTTLQDFSFVPAGRILAGAGVEEKLTPGNCYVLPAPKDSRSGIISTLDRMTEIMSRGGGVGIPIMSLRPRFGIVRGVNGRSSGSVAWGEIYSFGTGLIEQGGCFAPETRLSTTCGLLTAAELVSRIEAGEAIYVHTHVGLRRVTARFRNGSKTLLRVTTERGYEVTVTPEHKIALLDGANICTKSLHDLCVGNEILVLLGTGTGGDQVTLRPVEYERSIMSTTLNTDVRLPTVLDARLAYLLGYSYGDGYVQTGRKVTWQANKGLKLSVADSDATTANRLEVTVKDLFGITPTWESGDGACRNLAIYSRLLVTWLEQNDLLKEKTGEIRVPDAIMRSPSGVSLAFVAGYFDADGCNRGSKGGYGFDSISKAMLLDVQRLLATNGILSRLSSQDHTEQGWSTLYRLSVTGRTQRTRFAAIVPAEKAGDDNGARDENTFPFSVWTGLDVRTKYRQGIHDGVSDRISRAQLERIAERLEAHNEDDKAKQVRALLRTQPDRIVSIEPAGERETFDFEVEGVHLLSGDGIYTSNSRQGALMLMQYCWHPDIVEFITAKMDQKRLTKANISVAITDSFMEAVDTDSDWDLVFPDTSHPDYNAEWNGDLPAWKAAGRPVIVHRTMKARDLWKLIVESTHASGEPGLFFVDRYNSQSNTSYYPEGHIYCCNPCCSGDTRLATQYGLVPFKELAERELLLKVTTDLRAGENKVTTTMGGVTVRAAVPAFLTSPSAAIYRVETQHGYCVNVTEHHEFVTPEGRAELRDLRVGDTVFLQSGEGQWGLEVDSPALGALLGWMTGDGWWSGKGEAVLRFYGEKAAIAEEVVAQARLLLPPGYTLNTYSVGQVDAREASSEALARVFAEYDFTADTKGRVPEIVFRSSRRTVCAFLRFLFAADGQVNVSGAKSSNTCSARLSQSNLDLLRDVQLLLQNFGIVSAIYPRRKAGYRRLPDGRGGFKDYWCQAQFDLAVAKANLSKFADTVGFARPEHAEKYLLWAQNRKREPYQETFEDEIVSIEFVGNEPTYCTTQLSHHTIVVNGIVTGQCGEQGIPPWSVCNLGHLNLTRFLTGNGVYEPADVDWDKLGRTIKTAMRFMDDVVDIAYYPFAENERQQRAERRIGLGTMGLAEVLIRCHVRYGNNPDCLQFLDRLFSFIAWNAYGASADLAEEKGPFTRFDSEKLSVRPFIHNLPQGLQASIRKKGLRNAGCLTQAPTGTVGTMVGTSTGIEPFFRFEWLRNSRLGVHREYANVYEEYLEAHPDLDEKRGGMSEHERGSSSAFLPSWFVTTAEMTPEDHAYTQAAIQKWVDSSISKTSNVPHDYTPDQVGSYYRLLYLLGCKGGTVYRDGSREEQVLNSLGKADSSDHVVAIPELLPVPTGIYDAKCSSLLTPVGKLSSKLCLYPETGEPFEVWLEVSKAGSEVNAIREAFARLMSLFLRLNSPVQANRRVEMLVEQLEGLSGGNPVGYGPDRVLSLPDGISKGLRMALDALKTSSPTQPTIEVLDGPTEAENASQAPAAPRNGKNGHRSDCDVCPSCHQAGFYRVEGCQKCDNCGYSKC